jgi:GNAT superfamily N-acetyltransferase
VFAGGSCNETRRSLFDHLQPSRFVNALIREYRPSDEEPVVELSLRAWAPVFASLEQTLGREIFVRLHGDWSQYQASAVRRVLADAAIQVWVAEDQGLVVAFVAGMVDHERHLGEISMLAVDPDHQSEGVGGALTQFATDWLRRSGMSVALVETGGDPGHAAARHLYENLGYTSLPVARYFRALSPSQSASDRRPELPPGRGSTTGVCAEPWSMRWPFTVIALAADAAASRRSASEGRTARKQHPVGGEDVHDGRRVASTADEQGDVGITVVS